MDRIETDLVRDPWPGINPKQAVFGITPENDPGLIGPIIIHLDPDLDEKLGKPDRITITIEKG